jgi:hypothetical protein
MFPALGQVFSFFSPQFNDESGSSEEKSNQTIKSTYVGVESLALLERFFAQ